MQRQLQQCSRMHALNVRQLFALLMSGRTHVCFCLCKCKCVCVCVFMWGSSQCSALYKHISWADSARREGERALRQPGTEVS